MTSKPQYPVAGHLNKDFRVTGPFGYRMHPIRKERVHHNGVDLWGAKASLKLEVWFDGVVISKVTNMAGFGHYVVIRHNVFGKTVTSLYAHLKSPSSLRKGQRVKAGTVVGIMGASGAVTGKHLHFELGKGRNHPFISGGNGKRYYEPMTFIRSVIKKWEAEREMAKAVKDAAAATPFDAPDVEVPDHCSLEVDVTSVETPEPKNK